MTLGPQARVFLDGAYAEGKESEQASLDLAAHLDVSLKPMRSQLQDGDWRRSGDTRYHDWARTLAMLGPEVTQNPRLCYEVYVARRPIGCSRKTT